MAVSGTIDKVRITGMACAVPETVLQNDAFVPQFGAEQMQKFEKVVGVRERHVSNSSQTASDFACTAAEDLRKARRWNADDVDAVVFVTQSPDYVSPATACVIHKRLGIKKDCLAFDVNLGCSGFVYGIFIAASFLKMPGIGKVLLCGGDCVTKMVSPTDQSAAPLFGDGGFAVVLESSEKSFPMFYGYCSDGNGYKYITVPGMMLAGRRPVIYENKKRKVPFNPGLQDKSTRSPEDLYMDGMEVFNFTINEVPDLINAQMRKAQVGSDQIDLLVLHQANRFVLKQIAMATGFSMKKVPVSMDRYGNTSVASIPLTLCDYAMRNPGSEVKKILMSGFGVGFSWGTVLTDIDLSICLPIHNGTEPFKDWMES